jgi:UbiD family decarboxylase
MIMYRDLREWLSQVEKIGELRTVRGADWELEIGALTQVAYKQPGGGPLLVFDEIKGYPQGYRVITNAVGTCERLALTLGLPSGLNKAQLSAAWQEKYRQLKPVPHRVLSDGPVFENIRMGQEIDLFQFPTPRWHEGDGGRFIGTGSVDITADPDDGWVNLGCYRVQILDSKRAGFFISPGKHGRIHRDKYFQRGQACPVAVSVGHDPLVYLIGGLEAPYGISEYAIMGGLKGEPYDVVMSKVHRLPIPAYAEIVIEGISRPGVVAEEGPFGEWTGYYGSLNRAEPVIEVEAIYYRDDPIIFGAIHTKPPEESHFWRAVCRSALIKDAMRVANLPDVTGVWCHEIGGTRLLLAVSIKQRYPGHARQAAAIALQCQAGAYLGRYVVVVDDDIDVTDLNEVMWAVCTRSDPEESIDIMRRCWSGPLDPRIPEGRKGLSSRAIIDATRPFEWKDKFPPVVGASRGLLERVTAKWGDIFR